MKHFYSKRYLYVEKFYVKLLLGLVAIFLVATIISRSMGEKYNYFEAFFTQKDSQSQSEIKIWVWVVWSFLEHFILIRYLSKMYDIIRPRQFITMELYAFLIIWFAYNNLSFYLLYQDIENINSVLINLSLLVLYLCLFLHGYLQVLLSCTSKTLVTFHFTNKLMNNLYLFLTDESCYEVFNNYLYTKNEKGPFLLKLYTHIMKYKLDLTLDNPSDNGYASSVI